MARRDEEVELGTQELEAGMRPRSARDVAVIATIVVLMLAVFNSGGLARWTQGLPSSAANVWLADRAADWHDAMKRLGPSSWFDGIRARFRSD